MCILVSLYPLSIHQRSVENPEDPKIFQLLTFYLTPLHKSTLISNPNPNQAIKMSTTTNNTSAVQTQVRIWLENNEGWIKIL